jgi:hypothetical protein
MVRVIGVGIVINTLDLSGNKILKSMKEFIQERSHILVQCADVSSVIRHQNSDTCAYICRPQNNLFCHKM